ncbi:hypothetical protein ACOMHN_014769 [Nucella lapillus]
MLQELMDSWKPDGMNFICRYCYFQEDPEEAINKALKRIACASEERRLEVAKSEELLMLTYNLALPEVQPATSVSEIPDHAVDDTSAKILQQYHPILLSSYQPIYITGDGNCKYCKEVKRQNKREYIQIDPQPAAKDVTVVVRYYATLKADSNYKRRIIWVEYGIDNPGSKNVAVVEYKGQWTGKRISHGNSNADSKTEYVRTSSKVMGAIKENRHLPPKVVYNKLVSE